MADGRQVGTFGSSQGGFAQNFLAAMTPPSLVCQYMIDTGLSLYHEAYVSHAAELLRLFENAGSAERASRSLS